MSSPPQISIIVPVYKAETTLPPLVASIAEGSFQDFELLLIDDGSPDGSGAICDQLAAADLRIRVEHTSNRGPAAARNTGIQLARGAFIAFADSDDTVERDIYAELLATALHTGADITLCRINFIDNGRIEHRDNVLLPCLPSDTAFSWHDCKALLRVLLDVGPCNKLFRRDFLLHHQLLFPEHLHFGEDAELWFNALLLNPKLACTPYRGYNYIVSTATSLCKNAHTNNDTFPNTLRLARKMLANAGLWPLYKGEYCHYLACQSIAFWSLVEVRNRRALLAHLVPVFREVQGFSWAKEQRGPAVWASAYAFFVIRDLPPALANLALTPFKILHIPWMRQLLRKRV